MNDSIKLLVDHGFSKCIIYFHLASFIVESIKLSTPNCDGAQCYAGWGPDANLAHSSLSKQKQGFSTNKIQFKIIIFTIETVKL